MSQVKTLSRRSFVLGMSGAGYANFFYYAAKFQLEMEPATSFEQRPDLLLHLDGKLHTGSSLRADPGAWPVALHDAEKPLAPSRLLSHYLRPVATEIGTVDRVLAPEFADYDQLSLLEFLRQQGASDAAIQLIDNPLNYNSLATVSALSALRDAVRFLHVTGNSTLNIANGNATLTDAMAAELADHIQYRASLRSLRFDKDSAQLQIETKHGDEVWEADYVIIAIPFTALRKVKFDTQLPKRRQAIIDELPYTQVAQTYVQTREQFWQDEQPIAALYSDGPLERLFNASMKMSSGRGLLINWINGEGTGALKSMTPEEHAEFTLREMAKIWPKSSEFVEATYTNNWGNSYAEGAYAHYAPGQLTAHAADIPKPVECLHFAGEHTELVAPGMEGALTSGRRVAEEILARARL